MKEYWRAECYDNSGNYMEEAHMSEDEMKDWYEWHKDEFLISKEMTLEEFIVWQGFEEKLGEDINAVHSNAPCDTYGPAACSSSCSNYPRCMGWVR